MATPIGPHTIDPRQRAVRDRGLTQLDKQRIQEAIAVNLHGLSPNAQPALAGVMEGLLMGMSDDARADFIASLRANAQAANVAALARNAEEAQQLQQQSLLRRAAEELRRLEEPRTNPNSYQQLLQQLRAQNRTSGQALALAIALLGGSDKIAPAWNNYDNAVQQAAAERVASGALATYEIASSGKANGNMSYGVTEASYFYEPLARTMFEYAPPSTTKSGWYPRERDLQEQWTQENPETRPFSPIAQVPAQERSTALETVGNVPGTQYNPRDNTAYVPGVGRVAFNGLQSRVIETQEQLQARQTELEQRQRRAEELGARLLPDGKTMEAPDGSQFREEGNRTVRVRTPNQAAAITQRQTQSLIPRVEADERRRDATARGVPVEQGRVNGLHAGGVPVTGQEGAVIRQQVQQDQNILRQQRETQAEQERLRAGTSPRPETAEPQVGNPLDMATPALPPAPPPAVVQRPALGITDQAALWAFGDTASGRRLQSLEGIDTTNPQVRGAAERERGRAWTGFLAGALRRGRNLVQDGTDLITGNQTTEEQRREIARQTYRAAEAITGPNNTPEQQRIIDEARRREEAAAGQPQPPEAAQPTPPQPEPERPGIMQRLSNWWNNTPPAPPPAPPAVQQQPVVPPAAPPVVPPVATDQQPVVPQVVPPAPPAVAAQDRPPEQNFSPRTDMPPRSTLPSFMQPRAPVQASRIPAGRLAELNVPPASPADPVPPRVDPAPAQVAPPPVAAAAPPVPAAAAEQPRTEQRVEIDPDAPQACTTADLQQLERQRERDRQAGVPRTRSELNQLRPIARTVEEMRASLNSAAAVRQNGERLNATVGTPNAANDGSTPKPEVPAAAATTPTGLRSEATEAARAEAAARTATPAAAAPAAPATPAATPPANNTPAATPEKKPEVTPPAAETPPPKKCNVNAAALS